MNTSGSPAARNRTCSGTQGGLFRSRFGTVRTSGAPHDWSVARPASVHPDLVRAARRLARRKVGPAEMRRRLIPLAERLGVERPSYSFLRDLCRVEEWEDPVSGPSALSSVLRGRFPTLAEAEEALIEKPRRRRLRS